MILLSKQNFRLERFHRDPSHTPAKNDWFYSDIKICLVLEGFAKWVIEGKTLDVKKGDIVFLNIGQMRRFISFGKEGFDLCIFSFSRSAFSDLRHYLFFKDYAKKNPLPCASLEAILLEILDFWETGSSLRYEWATAKFTEFFIRAERLLGFTPEGVSARSREIFQQMDQIDASILKGISLREIANAVGLSESAFSRRFSSVVGIHFKQYAMEKKIQYALELLENTDRKTIDIAAECGFQSISGFYDTFRKLLGTTPNKIRSNLEVPFTG